jgi:molybdate transport system regulatory protein
MTTARPRPEVRFRLRMSVGERIAIGPGKIALLEAIRDHHSITAAAKALGMSYRRAWVMLDEVNGALKRPAVDTATGGRHGGGSALTPVGEEIIERYRRVEQIAAQACAEDIEALLGLIGKPRSGAR